MAELLEYFKYAYRMSKDMNNICWHKIVIVYKCGWYENNMNECHLIETSTFLQCYI